ncbi:MAG: hypothetical protein JXD22_15620 [Sedimentisphaerales bacterium]|nr:hypothetical protein [Sedimentisphaerales bacterium]
MNRLNFMLIVVLLLLVVPSAARAEVTYPGSYVTGLNKHFDIASASPVSPYLITGQGQCFDPTHFDVNGNYDRLFLVCDNDAGTNANSGLYSANIYDGTYTDRLALGGAASALEHAQDCVVDENGSVYVCYDYTPQVWRVDNPSGPGTPFETLLVGNYDAGGDDDPVCIDLVPPGFGGSFEAGFDVVLFDNGMNDNAFEALVVIDKNSTPSIPLAAVLWTENTGKGMYSTCSKFDGYAYNVFHAGAMLPTDTVGSETLPYISRTKADGVWHRVYLNDPDMAMQVDNSIEANPVDGSIWLPNRVSGEDHIIYRVDVANATSLGGGDVLAEVSEEIIITGNDGYNVVTNGICISPDGKYLVLEAPNGNAGNTSLPDSLYVYDLVSDYGDVSVDPLLVNLAEEGETSGTYTIVLDQEPNANVVVTATPKPAGQVKINGGSTVTLTFTVANYNTPQTITVSAVDDVVKEGNHSVRVQHTAVSSDSVYNGVYIYPCVANITDNDVAGVIIDETGGSTDVAEGGANDIVLVSLLGEPNNDAGNATVMVTLTVNDPINETTVDAGSGASDAVTLTFTMSGGASPWSMPQAVTVAAVDDNDEEGNHAGRINITVDSNNDTSGFDAVTVDNLWVNVTDNEAFTGVPVGKWLFNSASLSIPHPGSLADTSTVDADYDADVDFDSEVTTMTQNVDPEYLIAETPTPAADPNYDIIVFAGDVGNYMPQDAISVEAWFARDATTGNAALLACGVDTGVFERGFRLNGGNFDGAMNFAVAVEGYENDDSMQYVSSTTIPEVGQWVHVVGIWDGSKQQIYVDGLLENELERNPGGIDYSDTDFTFGLCTWIDDNEHNSFSGSMEHLRMYNYALDASTIMDHYVTMPPGSLTTVTESDGSTSVLEEGPTNDTYTLVLDIAPDANVYIVAEPPIDLDLGAGAGVSIELTFTTGNWNTEQTVVVTSVDDDELEGDEFLTIEHSISSAGDTDFDRSGVRKVYVTGHDNDCGLWGFNPMDFNEDCQVDLLDYSWFAMSWANCSQPYTTGCGRDFLDELVGYWSLDEDFRSDYALPNDGTPVGVGEPNLVAAKIGKGIQLYGDDYITIDDVAKFATGNTVSVSAWINTTSTSGGDRYVVATNTATGGNVLLFGVKQTGIVNIYNGTTYNAGDPGELNDGQWHLIGYSQDETTLKIFIDGQLRGSFTTTTVFSSDDLWSIGQEYDGGLSKGNFWIGVVDEVCIWNRALRADHMLDLWNSGNGRTPF